VGRNVGLSCEFKWYAPLEESEFRVVDYPLSPLDHGALGVVVGVTLYPGGGL